MQMYVNRVVVAFPDHFMDLETHYDRVFVLGLDGYLHDPNLDGYLHDLGLDGSLRDPDLDGYLCEFSDWDSQKMVLRQSSFR